MEPQKAADFKALDIVLADAAAAGSQVPDPNVPDAFAVIADRSAATACTRPTPQVVVYKLVGDFDPKEAISHGYHRQPAAARLADHQRLAGRFRRHAVVDHRGHLPPERR